MDSIHALQTELETLLSEATAAEPAHAALLAPIHPSYRQGARNLVHYVTLRQHDLRKLQLGLARQGLSSLGRIEGHVVDALQHVRERVRDMERTASSAPPTLPSTGPSWDDAERLLHTNTYALLGPKPTHRHVSIMVTAPAASEVTEVWMERLLAAGMNVLRINTAHEDAGAWSHIASTARTVAARRAQPLRIVVDLPGPKLRTVALSEGPRVVRFRPTRDELGRTIEPCTIALYVGTPPASAANKLAISEAALAQLRVGDEIELHDARGKKRTLTVSHVEASVALAQTPDTTYVVPETELSVRREGAIVALFSPTSVPPRAHRLSLRVGDRFALVRPGLPAPASLPAIGCTLDAALDALEPGRRVLFDDGHVESVVDGVEPAYARLRVTYAAGGEVRLGAEKGVNLPDTELTIPLLGKDDELALAFAVEQADVVGASFLRNAADVRVLHRRLAELGAQRLGIVLKIETAQAFAALPEILFAALERPCVGVMIARGDLAIETGYERLAELQEEILWLAEAAHLPVIWATQVLDLQARTGRPSRAEVTDAAMSVRAECVMLNKGPFVAEAVEVLDDILRRMEQHQYKKRSLYRRLHLQLPP